jgi:oligopeptidase B
MTLFNWMAVLAAITYLIGCASTSEVNVPVPKPKKIAKKMTKHGDTRVDPYFWMKNRDRDDVLKHLKEENRYSSSHLGKVKDLQEDIFEEMKGRVKKQDQSVPVVRGQYEYWTEFEEDSEYSIIKRRKVGSKEKGQVILDGNLLAKGHNFFSLGNYSVSSDGNMLAYAMDTVGRRLYTIYFRDLKTGKDLKYKIENITGNMTWAEGSNVLFYSKQDLKTLRHQWIYSVDLKTQKPKLVFHEKDDKFFVGVGKTRSKKYIVISSGSTESSESLLIPADQPNAKPVVFAKREPKHKYSIAHAGSFFYVLTNKNAKNFKVMRTPSNIKTNRSSWTTVLGHRQAVYVRGLDAFKSYLVLEVRKAGVTEIEIMSRLTGKRYFMEQPEKSHMVGTMENPQFDAKELRYFYTSMTTPMSVIDYNFAKKTKILRKVKEVLGGFNKDNYISERIMAPSHDGVKIPISLVYKKGFKKDGKAPLILYGYGSYGISIDPTFNDSRLSLLDRGFVFAIAHIRGSSTMGRQWYLDGKYLKKKNTFKDFIAAGEFLVKKKYTQSSSLYAMGGSAGGLLMGAVINMRPDLFNGVVAAVPFVDVVTTMLDDSLPLTTNEYEEWGNPNVKKYYTYMKSYSPYDNIKKQKYPYLLVTSGYHDSQVQYWEPTKWVAKLRDYNQGQSLILLHTELEAGHGGQSGRFKSLQDRARDYAFLIGLEQQKL